MGVEAWVGVGKARGAGGVPRCAVLCCVGRDGGGNAEAWGGIGKVPGRWPGGKCLCEALWGMGTMGGIMGIMEGMLVGATFGGWVKLTKFP